MSIKVSTLVAGSLPRKNCIDVKEAQIKMKNNATLGESKAAAEIAEDIADPTIVKLMVLARRLAIAAAAFSFGSVAPTIARIAATSANMPPAKFIAELTASIGIFITATYLLKLHNVK